MQAGQQALKVLETSPENLGEQTTLRRAFHTLKGSSRMVGLKEFGEAAWAMEQLVNTWLAEQKPASEDLLVLCDAAMHQFSRWVEDIATGASTPWSAQPFHRAADGLRLDHLRVALDAPSADVVEAVAEAAPQTAPAPQTAAPTALPVQPAEVEPVFPSFAATQMFDTPANAQESPRPDFQPTQTYDGESAPDKIAPAPAGLDLDDFDFGGRSGEEALLDFDESAEAAATPLPSELLAAESEFDSFVARSNTVAARAADGSDVIDDQTKVIGDLHIGIPLYNVYLNEADEWSRRLLTELNEWELELHQPIPDSTIGLAHALGGSSATVGFVVLSDVARLLEQTLQHVQLHGQGLPEHARVFNVAAEEIRRLLHQFAAGFLKQADPAVLQALQGILQTEFPFADGMLPAPPAGLTSVRGPMLQGETGAAQLIAFADEETDVVDALDADLFPIFEEEAADLFPQLGGALRQWASRPDNLGARNEALRVLHTLKGSARLAGAMRLGELTHRLESAIEALGVEHFKSSQIEPLLARFDGLQAIFDGLRKLAQQAHVPVEGHIEAPAAASTDEGEAPAIAHNTMDRRTRGRVPGSAMPVRTVGSQTLRVSAHLLDRLVNQAGEVIISRSRVEARLGQMRASLKDLAGNLDRLREQLREMELQSESQMQSRMAQTKDQAQDFDPLEFDRFTRVQELTRIMAESVADVATVQRNLQRTMEGTEDDLILQARQARELQRDLLRTRMVEFEGISERLYGVVRQASKDAGKQVKLDIIGGSMELDRSVLERMAPAFEHMLRNAVAHGIESPAHRVAAGKSPVGTITIELRHEGNDVSVEFSDDGAGLDLKRIYDKAVTNGLVGPGSVLGNDEIANLIFAPGFSTADKVTELSGRGIGLDVVRAEVDALGGRIETSARAGAGTTFKLVVPLTTAVTQVVMLRVGDLAVGVPSNLVEIVKRVPAAEVAAAYQSNTFTHDGEPIPFYWAGSLLQANASSREPVGRHLAVVVFRSAGQRVAAHVDEVLGNQEVVVKNLGPQLSRVPGLTGMSVLASGAVVLIYNLVALATVYGHQALKMQSASRQALSEQPSEAGNGDAMHKAMAPVQTPLVMVVDDSITVRRVTQRLLKREGYRVVLANDGLQAMERLQEERPAVVLSDIEMPRMDGFDLARNIRSDERLRDLPIIMITSRIAEKHRERARELGVDHYLGKPYSEEELLGLIRNYCALPLDANRLP